MRCCDTWLTTLIYNIAAHRVPFLNAYGTPNTSGFGLSVDPSRALREQRAHHRAAAIRALAPPAYQPRRAEYIRNGIISTIAAHVVHKFAHTFTTHRATLSQLNAN